MLFEDFFMRKYPEPLGPVTIKLPVRALKEIRCLAGERKLSDFIRVAIENYLVLLKSQGSDKEVVKVPANQTKGITPNKPGGRLICQVCPSETLGSVVML